MQCIYTIIIISMKIIRVYILYRIENVNPHTAEMNWQEKKSFQ